MNIQTRLFGEIEIDESKIINFKEGMIGFEELKRFMIMHDAEAKSNNIMWLQAIDEGDIAFPVMDPLLVKNDFNPIVEDELLKCIGDIDENEEMLVLTTLTVPSDITKISTNLRAPIVINSHTKMGCQIIVDNDDYPVRYYIYDILKANKE